MEVAEEGVAHAATRLADLMSLHCETHYGPHGCALIDGVEAGRLARAISRRSGRVLAPEPDGSGG